MSQQPSTSAAPTQDRYRAVLQGMAATDPSVRRRQMHALLRGVVTEGAKR